MTTTNDNSSSIPSKDIDLHSPQPSNSGIFTRWVKGVVRGALLRKRKPQKTVDRREIFNLNLNKSDVSIATNNICLDNDCWAVDEEILNKDELITPEINSALFVEMRSDIYDLSAVISNPIPDDDHQQPSQHDDFEEDFLENTCIVSGSEEHFAFVRTLRKLRVRKVGQRPIHQVLLLNKILTDLSSSQTSDQVHDELIRFKSRVYELNRIKRNNNKNKKRSSLSSSSSSWSPSSPSSKSASSKRLTAMLAGIYTVSPITMKYRPSYASSKVMTIFDEASNQLVTKDLPMARRRKRLSDLSNILARSTSSSSASSANSSQSSLVTLPDDVEQKYSSFTTKVQEDTFLPNIVIRQDDDDEDGDEEDHVPLFVLKEQFKYSGRGYGLFKNTPVTLAV